MVNIHGVEVFPHTITVNIGPKPLQPGVCFMLFLDSERIMLQAIQTVVVSSPVPSLVAGMQLKSLEQGQLQVRWLTRLPESSRSISRAAWVEVQELVPAGVAKLQVIKDGISLAWITMSDKASIGTRIDISGPSIETLIASHLKLVYTVGFVLPDEELVLRSLLVQLALEQGFDLIFTTGGTGVALRDITPEAVLAVIEKRLYGFEQVMTTTSLINTPHAMLSRAVVGTLGRTLIITLPGSAKAVEEILDAILPALPHCLAKLQGDLVDCGY